MLTSRNKQATRDTDTASRSSRPVDMQWETKGQFSGQVKPVGIEKSMGWKMGFVHFDHDTASGAWMARLYFKVNPSRLCQQMKIGRTDNLDVKCGRLMIENKKGDGIHIKLSSGDVTHAKLLVSKIKNSIAATATGSKAEVGVCSHTVLFSQQLSENVRLHSGQDWFDWSLNQANVDKSPEQQSLTRLSKNSAPRTAGSPHNAAPKRKLELFSPERLDVGGREKDVSTPHRFTGMKDYSKRNLHGGISLSVENVIGPKSFYGTQKLIATNNVHRNTQVNSYQVPALKKPKLSSSSLTIASSRMLGTRDESSRAREPGQTSDVSRCRDSDVSRCRDSDVSRCRDSSPSVLDNPKHRVTDGETIGFQNLGNTCFLNAPLQCLSALEPLTLDIQAAVARYGRDLKSNTVTRKLYQLMKDVRRNDVCPEHIKELLVTLRVGMNVKFAPNTQQDAHELLSELLNRVDEEVKVAMRLQASSRLPLTTVETADSAGMRPLLEQLASEAMPLYNQVPTPTESNFCWSYRTCIYFHQCKTEVVSSQTEQEMTLMLALDPTTKNLQDCIHKYFESTDVEMKCEKCGRNENVTITRKIVRRPRVFILNLLRYHSDNMESTKKADLIHVPSYISIYDYCAADVVKPTHIDAVLLLDRLSQSAVDVQNAFARVLNTWDRGQQVQAWPPAGAEIGRCQDKPEILCELVAVLADLVSCNLRAVTTYMEHFHNRGQDINQLYMQVQNAIHKLKTNIATALKCKSLPPDSHVAGSFGSREMLLSEILLKKSLLLDKAQLDSLPEDALHLVIEDLLVTHYEATDSNDKCMNDLINNLGLCVVLVESGAVDADSPGQRAVLARLHVTLEKLVLDRSSVAFLDRGCPDGDSDVDIGGEVEGSHVQVEEDVYFKRTQATQVYDSSDITEHQTEKNVENLSDEWNYAHWGNDEEKQRQPLSDITMETSYRATSPDSSSDMLQGKHISSYTEADLLKIETTSLTDEETIVYVTALSRFEYEKEQACMLGTSTTASFDWPETGAGEQAGAGEQPGADCTHLQALSGRGALLKPNAAHGVGSHTAEIQESSNGSSSPCARAEMFSKTCTSAGNVSVGLGPHLKSGTEAVDHRMLCHEQMVDSESAGNSHDSSGERSLQAATALRKSVQVKPLMGTDLNDISIKHCVSCGNLFLTDCTICGALDQTDFDCYPLDASLCTLPAETVACPKSTNTEESSLILCGQASGKGSDLSLAGDIVDGMTSTEVQPSIQVAAVGEQGSQQCCMAASRKEFLFSPPKTNNLTRTRDYARLKSPASSPKKRTAKGPSPKSDCVTKRQHYSEKGGKLDQALADSNEDVCSRNPELQNTSMEENVDDLSFCEHQQTVDASALVLQSTPASAGGRQDHPSQTPVDCDQPTSASTAGLEVSNLSSQVSHLSGVQVEALDSSTHAPKSRVATSEGLQENIQPQVSVTPKRRVIRSSATYLPDIEEKENVHQDRSRGGQLTVIEDGRQDLSYKLVSVVDHTGSSQFTGHYTAYAFNISRQTWFHLNDIETRTVTEGAVREANTKTGYLFFYMDKDLFDEYSSKTSSGMPRC